MMGILCQIFNAHIIKLHEGDVGRALVALHCNENKEGEPLGPSLHHIRTLLKCNCV